jgi:hypothetical protein
MWKGLDTRGTPGCPEIHKHYVSLEIRQLGSLTIENMACLQFGGLAELLLRLIAATGKGACREQEAAPPRKAGRHCDSTTDPGKTGYPKQRRPLAIRR